MIIPSVKPPQSVERIAAVNMPGEEKEFCVDIPWGQDVHL